jgi:hypothetical protein
MGGIEGPYEAFAETLRGGDFGIPVDPAAWPAELVAAHVIMNNDLLTEAARAVKSGGEPTYDSSPSHDGHLLRELLIRTGSLTELADEVERSASDLQAAYDMLDAQQRRVPVPSRIVHEGEVVMDGPRAIGDLVEVNAAAHLEDHLQQLLDLRD